MLNTIILLAFLGIVGFFIWRKYKEQIKSFLNLGGKAEITPEKLKALEEVQKAEKDKADKLTAKAILAESIRKTNAEIAKEKKRQAEAKNRIAGRQG
jgi:hypothetical protein